MNIERLVHVNGLTVLIDLEAFGGGSHGWENVSSVEKRLKSYSGERTERPSVKLAGGCKKFTIWYAFMD